VTVLAMQQALLKVLLPLIVAAHFWSAAMIDEQQQPDPQAAAQPQEAEVPGSSWKRVLARRGAAAAHAWDRANRAVVDLCTGRGYPCLQLGLAAWQVLGILWLVCKAVATNGDVV